MHNGPEWICPLCGTILSALAEYHGHYAKIHGRGASAANIPLPATGPGPVAPSADAALAKRKPLVCP